MKLNEESAALVKGLLQRGEKQHDIASFFGVNGGRIAEIKTGMRFPDVAPAPKRLLPKTTALAGGVTIHHARQALTRVQAAIDSAHAYLDEIEKQMDVK